MPAMSAARSPQPAEPDRDWPVQAADAIVDVVDRAREATTARAVVAARAIVFGLVISILAVIALVSFVVGIVRGTQVLLGAAARALGYELPHSRAVWLSYLIVGAIFLALGIGLWYMANRRAVGATTATTDSVEIEEQR
jgi:hypothetical protein